MKALAPEKYARACGRLLTRLKDPKGMVPVRPLCYDAGAALLLLCKEQGLPVCMEVGVVDTYLVEVPPVTQKTALPAHEQVRREIQERREAFSRLIQTAAMRAPLAQGDFKLLGVNVYSAMYMEGYVYTEYFLMYEGETGSGNAGREFPAGNGRQTDTNYLAAGLNGTHKESGNIPLFLMQKHT